MAEKIYAVVGSFAMKSGSEKGIHVFEYEPEHAGFIHLCSSGPEINAGQGTYNKEKDVLYITDESKDGKDEIGGGGRILAARLDRENGSVTWLNEKDTFAPLPSYLCLTRSGKYAAVPHHGTGNVVTKTIRKKDGSYGKFTDGDDGTVALFRIGDDGTYSEMCDVCYHEIERENGKIKKIPHLHCFVQSPDGKLFLACDKGLDSIHSYHIDEEQGKIIPLGKIFVENGVHPRYGAFHPTIPVFYNNCENSVYVHAWTYDSETGELEKIQKVPLLFDKEKADAWKAESCADILLSSDGKFLYVSVRGLNVLSVFEVAENGTLNMVQNIDCQGKNPRGLSLSPDERFLFCMNRDSDHIARFKRNEDGTLTAAGCETFCILPGNMIFVSYE